MFPKLKLNKKQGLLLASGIISFIALFIIGRWGWAVAYKDSILPSIKLLIIKLFLLFTLTVVYYYLIREFLEKNVFKIVGMALLALVCLYAALYTVGGDGYTLIPLGYIRIGEYLRDVHGINIFFMDWGGWEVSMVIYIAPIYEAFVVWFYYYFLKVTPRNYKR